jgi:predicted ribosome quality control (RQC) complex YloA/Tae2 family protein
MPETQEVETVTIQAVPKKPRTEAQLLALEQARKKAYAMRAEKSALKLQEKATKAVEKIEAGRSQQETKSQPVEPQEEEAEDEPEVVYRKRPTKKKKRVVVVQAESSSDSEIEVRLPRPPKTEPPKEKTLDEIRFEKNYNKLFSLE